LIYRTDNCFRLKSEKINPLVAESFMQVLGNRMPIEIASNEINVWNVATSSFEIQFIRLSVAIRHSDRFPHPAAFGLMPLGDDHEGFRIRIIYDGLQCTYIGPIYCAKQGGVLCFGKHAFTGPTGYAHSQTIH
jgi:hypothetical protein